MPSAHPPEATWRKIGVRGGDRVVLLRAPATWTTRALDDDVVVARRRRAMGSEVVVAFFGSVASLTRDAERLAAAIVPNGMVWVAWPRRAGGHVSDLSDEAVRATMLPTGLVDVKVAALDEHWSGLKFVWRKELRASLRSRR